MPVGCFKLPGNSQATPRPKPNSRPSPPVPTIEQQLTALLNDERRKLAYLENRFRKLQISSDNVIIDNQQHISDLERRLEATESAEAAANSIIFTMERQLEASNNDICTLEKLLEQNTNDSQRKVTELQVQLQSFDEMARESEREAGKMISSLETLMKVVQNSSEQSKQEAARKIARLEERLRAAKCDELSAKRKIQKSKKQIRIVKASLRNANSKVQGLEHRLKHSIAVPKPVPRLSIARNQNSETQTNTSDVAVPTKVPELTRQETSPVPMLSLYPTIPPKPTDREKNRSLLLIDAVKKNDLPRIRDLLQMGSFDLELRDQSTSTGMTALMIASSQGFTETVKLLLNHGAAIEARNRDENTALILASQKGHIETVRALIHDKANPEIQNKFGKTALFCAVEADHLEIVKVLCEEAGADVETTSPSGQTVLSLAASLGYTQDVKFLLEQCCAKLETRNSNADGNTALLEAARCGNLKTVDLLLDYGASIEKKNFSGGKTALMLAMENDFVETSRLFIKRGANVDVKDSVSGRTMLHWAAAAGKAWKIKFLLANGADRDLKDENGKTAIELAREEGHNDCFDLLSQPNLVMPGIRMGVSQLAQFANKFKTTKPGAKSSTELESVAKMLRSRSNF